MTVDPLAVLNDDREVECLGCVVPAKMSKACIISEAVVEGNLLNGGVLG